jgi:cyclohexanone monooxygenase
VSYIINEVLARGKQEVEVAEAAEEAWVEEIVKLAGTGAQAFLAECTPGYYNREGQGSGGNMQNSPYAPGINAFNALLAAWREKGNLEGMTLR